LRRLQNSFSRIAPRLFSNIARTEPIKNVRHSIASVGQEGIVDDEQL
jgi:hypothetical protein